jgi:hypothetical protein
MTTNVIAGIEKSIVYDRQTRDYACSIIIDGGEPQFIGYASTYGQAETACNGYVYEYLTDSHTIETACDLLLQGV